MVNENAASNKRKETITMNTTNKVIYELFNLANLHLDLLERVNANPPHWAEDILLPYGDVKQGKLLRYAISKYNSYKDSVNVQDVVGTAHPDYANKSWLWLLNNGERMNANLSLLATNPSYYLETSKKEPEMGFIEIDGKTYINSFIRGKGNHRTCIARFFLCYQELTVLHGVEKTTYLIDHHFKSLVEALEDTLTRKRIHYSLDVIKTAIERVDTSGGWYRDNYSLQVKLEIPKNGWNGYLTAKDIQEILIDSERPFNKYFGKYSAIWK
jgi:hypothetical protein